MRDFDIQNAVSAAAGGLENSEHQSCAIPNGLMRRLLRLVPLRERALLRLLHHRGATYGELAAALGVSRQTLRRGLAATVKKATDPLNVEVMACWSRLSEVQRRLVYLHRGVGMSLREISRLRLVAVPSGRSQNETASSVKALREAIRQIQRLARRHAGRSLPASPDVASSEDSSAG